MLRHTSWVVVSEDYLETSFQVSSLLQQTAALVSLRVLLGSVHIAFAVHHFVVFPVDDRSASHSHLEDIGISEHEVRGHEATERPSVNSHPVFVNIRQGFQELHALHLVLHLLVAEVTESHLLEVATSPFASSVVEDEQQIALRCHISFPSAQTPVPASIDVVGVRSTVNIYYCRIALCAVEINGLHHSVVEVGGAIGSLDTSTGDFGYLVTLLLPGVFGCEYVHNAIGTRTVAEERLCGDEVDAAWNCGRRIAVESHCTVLAEGGRVYSLVGSQQGAARLLQIEAEETACSGVNGVAPVNRTFVFGVEAHQLLHLVFAVGHLLRLASGNVEQIEMVEPVASALHQGFRTVPRQEGESVHRFHIFLVAFLEELFLHGSRLGVIRYQSHVVLVAVEFEDVKSLAIGCP